MGEDGEFAHLAAQHTLGAERIPHAVRELAGSAEPELVWRNELGGLTFRFANRYVKWNPRGTGIDLGRERMRLDWIAGRYPAPRVLDAGVDGDADWLVTEALDGEPAVGDRWRTWRGEAIGAIAAGLRALHAIPADEFPEGWTAESWVGARPESLGTPPPVDDPVLVHGDACAPNTLISDGGQWVGNVDFGDLAVGDRWADLAIASLSLDWNFGEGHQGELFKAYASSRTRGASSTTAGCGTSRPDHRWLPMGRARPDEFAARRWSARRRPDAVRRRATPNDRNTPDRRPPDVAGADR